MFVFKFITYTILKISLLSYSFPLYASDHLPLVAENKRKISEAIISISYLLGSYSIPLEEISCGFDTLLENKNFSLKEHVKDLQRKNLLKAEIIQDKYLITLNESSISNQKVISDKEILHSYLPNVIHILKKAFDKNWEELIIYTSKNPKIILMVENFLRVAEQNNFHTIEILKIKIHLFE